MPDTAVETAEPIELPRPKELFLLDVIARAASDPRVDVAKFERLLALKHDAERELAERAFAEAFTDLGPDLPSIDRNGRIVVYSRADRDRPGGPRETDRPIQSTPYAQFDDILEAVRAPLHRHGFAVRFEFATVPDGRLVTTAVLTHRAGHHVSASTPPLGADTTGSKNPTQAMGSTMSYGMRYALRAVVPIVSHAPQDRDDDGNASAATPLIDDDQMADIERWLEKTSTEPKTFLAWVEQAQGAPVVDLRAMNVETYKRAVSYLATKYRRQGGAVDA